MPLSGELLQRLEREGFDALLEAAPQSALFLTDAAFDTSKIPVTDRVLDSCLQTRSLILLTQDAQGVRRLQIVTERGGRYAVAPIARPASRRAAGPVKHGRRRPVSAVGRCAQPRMLPSDGGRKLGLDLGAVFQRACL